MAEKPQIDASALSAAQLKHVSAESKPARDGGAEEKALLANLGKILALSS